MTLGFDPLGSAPIAATLESGGDENDEAWVVSELTAQVLGVVVLAGTTMRLEE